jgi:hypothetical protein
MQLIVLALATALVLSIGPSLGVSTTVVMPGGSSAWAKDGASQTISDAYQFVYDANDALAPIASAYITADIMAMAQTTASGKANVEVTVPAGTKMTLPGATLGSCDLKVNADGTVKAYVEGKNADAKVATLAQIHSDARYVVDSTLPAAIVKTLSGESVIYSVIGEKWAAIGGVTEAAQGQFIAGSFADGNAGYTGTVAFDSVAQPSTKQTVTGKVKGTTTLDADTTLGSAVGSANIMNPDSPARAQLKSVSSITYDDAVANKRVSKYSASNENMVDVAARINCVTPTGKETTVAGTAKGEDDASANQRYYLCDPATGACDERIYSASTEKSADMAADVSVSENFDSASSVAALTPLATIEWLGINPTDYTYDASNTITTTNQLSRAYDSTKTAHAEAFITSGDWMAKAGYSSFLNTPGIGIATTSKDVSVSGELGWVFNDQNGQGVGGGAFLKDRKTGPSWAQTSLTQRALLTPLAASTASSFIGDIQGPKAAGADAEDGSGVYGAYKNVNMNVGSELNGITSITSSTDVANINSYLWVDGTSPAMWQGYGFDLPTNPVFVPSGSWTGVQFTYTNSPTQRRTSVSGATQTP